MPIYAYRCATCGHAKDVLRKISDPALTECPACGAATFVKQVTAAGFQLKGSGWYVTDFRGDSKGAKPAEETGETAAAKSEDNGKAEDGKKEVQKSEPAKAEPAKSTGGEAGPSAATGKAVPAPATAAPAASGSAAAGTAPGGH